MSADMARAMRDDTGGARDLSTRARVALFAVALAAVTLPACQQDATPDPFKFGGPSELGLSLTLTASPDVLALDGASQSLVTILARDGSGDMKPNVMLRLQIRFNGVLQDYGRLSTKTLVTGQFGRAVATYTAPLSLSNVDTEQTVEIVVTPIVENSASPVPRSLTIRLVPSGTVIPPFSLTAGFRFTPSDPDPTVLQDVLFETNCVSASDTNCVTGPVVSYAWDFGDGNTASGPTATHVYSSVSTFAVTLTVTDPYNRRTSASQTVTTTAGPTPTPKFSFSPSAPNITTRVRFDATLSTAPPGRTITAYDWDFGDGVTKTGVISNNSFSVAGEYAVTLTVTDSLGVTATTSKFVPVVVGEPTPVFVFSPTDPAPSTAVQFNASGSFAVTGRTIVSYAWDWGDGTPTGTGVTTSHTFGPASVTYNVTLTVTDSAGATRTKTEEVKVGVEEP